MYFGGYEPAEPTQSVQKAFKMFLITDIDQSIFELCERKEKVGRSDGYIQTRAFTGLVVTHCSAAITPKGKSCLAWHVNSKYFYLLPTVVEPWAEICSDGRHTLTIRRQNKCILTWLSREQYKMMSSVRIGTWNNRQ